MPILIHTPPGIAIKPLCKVFEHSGIAYDSCTNLERTLQLCAYNTYSALVVIHTDNLADLLEFHHKWRQLRKKCAFIVISKRQSGVERAHALNAGISSYHIAPFSYTQLVRDVAQHEYQQDNSSHIVETHGIEVDTVARSVQFNKKFLRLTRKQFDLLALLVRFPGQVFSRVQIWEYVWSDGEYPLANTVDVHVNRLRKSLPKEAADLIETVYGFGYRIRPR